jgi:hypothetical protein
MSYIWSAIVGGMRCLGTDQQVKLPWPNLGRFSGSSGVYSRVQIAGMDVFTYK